MQTKNRVREWMEANPNQPASMYVAAFASVLELNPNEAPNELELRMFIDLSLPGWFEDAH